MMKKRLMSIVLCLCMVLTLLPTAALAAGDDELNFDGAKEGETTFTIDSVTYTYKGDATNTEISMVTGSGDAIPRTGNCIWQAGSGYVLYHPTETGPITGRTGDYVTAAEVTLHGATVTTTNSDGNPAIKLPYYQYGAGGQQPTNVTLTLEGDSTLTGQTYALVHYNGSLSIVGGTSGGTLTLNGKSILGPTTIGNGASVIQGVGTAGSSGAITTNLNHPLTVETGGSYTIAGGATLYPFSGSIDVKQGSALTIAAGGTLDLYASSPAILTFNGTVTNSGSIYFKDGVDTTKIPAGITGSGVVQTRKYENNGYVVTATLVLSGGEWLVSGGDVNSTGLDLTTAPAVKTVYTAGTNGTILWEPTLSVGESPAVTGGTLTFTGATMNVTSSGNTTYAVTLPNLMGGVNVVFKGTNSITANNNTTATAIKCPGDTTFELKDGNTTLTAKNAQNASGIGVYGGSTDNTAEITGTGKLTVIANGDVLSYAINAGSRSVKLTGGTLDFRGKVDGTVTLGGITVPDEATLDLSYANSVTKGTTGAAVYGALRMKDGTTAEDINALGLTGTGTVKVGDITYGKAADGAWAQDVTTTGLELNANTPTVKTTYKAGDGYIVWTPTLTESKVTSGTLTLHNATITDTREGTNINENTDSDVNPTYFDGDNERFAALRLPNDLEISVVLEGTSTLTAKGENSMGIWGNFGTYKWDFKEGVPLGTRILFSGSGTLNVVSQTNGIRANHITVNSGTLNVTAQQGVGDWKELSQTALYTHSDYHNAGVTLNGGKVNITTVPYQSENGGVEARIAIANAAFEMNAGAELTTNGTIEVETATVNSGAKLTAAYVQADTTSFLSSQINTLDWKKEIKAVLDEENESGTHDEAVYTLTPYGAATLDHWTTYHVCPTTTILNTTAGNTLTIPSDLTLDLNGFADSTIAPQTVINNGTILLPAGTTGDGIKVLGLTGSGMVKVGDTPYTNSGDKLHILTAGLDFTDSATGAGATLENDGYSWDSTTNTLTLGNLYMDVSSDKDAYAITLPNNADINLALEGTATLASQANAIFSHPVNSSGTMTISGSGTLNLTSTKSYGIRIGQNLTVTGGTVNASGGSGGIAAKAIEISGSTVNATGTGEYSSGISAGSTLTISSGTVRASGGVIGLGAMDGITISGGSVTATMTGEGQSAVCSDKSITLTGMEIKSPAGAKVQEMDVGSPAGSWFAIVNAAGVPANTVTIGKKTVSSGGSSNTTTTTETNPDGSTTTTVINKTTGTVTATTKNPDGSSTVVETKNDGTATTTDKAANGVTTVTKTDKDGVATGTTVTVPSSVKDPVKVNVPTDLGKQDGTVSAEITYPNGTKETVTGTYADGKVSLTVSGSATIEILDDFVPLAAALPFTDVPADAWYYNELLYAYNNGVFAGTSTTTFSPNANMTRQQMWMVLARMAGENPADMAAAQKWATENGVSDGSNPTNNVTREQFVTLLWRSVGSPAATKDMSGYTDFDAVADYARDAMRWAVENGIVAGTSATTLSPEATATRAQVAVILARYKQK